MTRRRQNTKAAARLRVVSHGRTADVAAALGVHPNTLTAWRQGYGLPSRDHMDAIEERYGIPMADWLTPATFAPSAGAGS